ncbi:MAG: SinI family restriction endonuclease [Opitutales bacterium]|nr:SinI family restriction endonuclease [Opitutales bacterium]
MTDDSSVESIYKRAILSIIPEGKIRDYDLIKPFTEICQFLAENPHLLSWRGRQKPDLRSVDSLKGLANKFVNGFKRSDFPREPNTVPDNMVSVVMEHAYGLSSAQCDDIKLTHQRSMCAENCVGNLLERYIDSVMTDHGWTWCCGDFVRAIDFIHKTPDGWEALQIKNRDNSENSSSSAIRNNTTIQKWFRTYSKTGKTNWDKLPETMQNKGLSEDGFEMFVADYLLNNKPS